MVAPSRCLQLSSFFPVSRAPLRSALLRSAPSRLARLRLARLRASVSRESIYTCKAGTGAPSSGVFSTLPERKEHAPRPHSHLTSSSPSGNSLRLSSRAPRQPSAGLPPPSYPRPSRLREAGPSLGVRLRLREDRRRVLLGEHAAS